jgi:hypothetical protein
MNNSVDRNTFAILLTSHQHIHENIKFADQKAAFFVTLDGAVLTAVYSLIRPGDYVCDVIGYEICALLLLAMGFGVYTIWPRALLRRGNLKPGVIDPIRIRKFKEEEFLARCIAINDDELQCEARQLIYFRATTNYTKYWWLTFSLVVSIAGWLSAIVYCAVLKIRPAVPPLPLH